MITKLFDRVKELITKTPSLADDDTRLVTAFWYYEIINSGKDINAMSAIDLLRMIKTKQLPNHDIITRNRRLVEERCPALRGKTWTERQNKKLIAKQQIQDF